MTWQASRFWGLVLLVPALLSGSARDGTADDLPDTFVKQLLETYWERGLENNKASAACFSRAQQSHPNHESVLLAYVANRMQHRVNRDALQMARVLNRLHPTNLDGWLMRVWLEALTDNYNQSLVAMIQMQRQIKQQQVDPAIANGLYSRLGRLIGYMQGPVQGKVTPDTLQTALRSLAVGMDQAQLDLFNLEREKVLNRFEGLSQTHARKIADDRDDQLKADQIEAANLERRNMDLRQQADQVAPRIDQVRNERDREIAALRSQVPPVESQLESTEADLRAVRFDLQLMYDDLFRLQARNPHHPHIPYLVNQIRNAEWSLSGLTATGRDLSARLSGLYLQLEQVRAGFDARLARLNNEIEMLDRQRRKNNRRLGELARGPRVAAGKIDALKERVEALTTYDPFPFELVRLELADKLIK